MAAVLCTQTDTAHEIRFNLGCKLLNHTYSKVYSEIISNRKIVSEIYSLGLELDVKELQELLIMCKRPLIRDVLEVTVMQIVTILKKTVCEPTANKTIERQWSDEVAGSKLGTPVNDPAITYKIETVITPRPSHFTRDENPTFIYHQ